MTSDLDAAADTQAEGDEDLLTRNQASEYLQRFGIRMKPTTLARAWSVGNGPPCRHIRGKPLYPRGVLRGWAEAQDTGLRHGSWERASAERRAP
jgi:hypothetical protein